MTLAFSVIARHHYSTALQCSPVRRTFMECSIFKSVLLKHLVVGKRQQAPDFSAFHWSRHGSLVSIVQLFVTKRVVHLPKRTETCLITESDRSGHNDRIVLGCADRA